MIVDIPMEIIATSQQKNHRVLAKLPEALPAEADGQRQEVI